MERKSSVTDFKEKTCENGKKKNRELSKLLRKSTVNIKESA